MKKIRPIRKCAQPACEEILLYQLKYCSRSCASRHRVAWNKGLHNENGKYAYKKFKKDHCERCGFLPEDLCQLDVDHKDGNHKNNELSNLQTLCANCHRLKTKQHRNYINYNKIIVPRIKIVKPRKTSKLCKKIICIETGIIYPSIKQAGLDLQISDSNICHVLKGNKKRAKNLSFKYLE